MSAPASNPAISAAIVEGENPSCSSHRSGPNDGPRATKKSAAGLMCCSYRVEVGEAELMRHQDRVGDLVELGVERVGRRLAVDERVARHRPIGLLLTLEQEQRRVACRLPDHRRPSTPSTLRTGRGRTPRGMSRSRCWPDHLPTRPGPMVTTTRQRSRRGTSCLPHAFTTLMLR